MVATFERLGEVSPKLEKALEEIARVAEEVRLFMPELKKTNDRIQNFIGGDPKGPKPGDVAFQDEPAQDNLRTLIRDVRALVATIRPAVGDIREAVEKLEPEIAAATKSARATLDKAGTTFDKAGTVIDKAGTAIDNVNAVLSPENRKQVDELLKNLNGIGTNVLRLSAGFQSLLDEAERTVKNFDKRTELTADVLADIRKFTQPLAAQSEGLVRDVAESAGQLNKIITEVREVVRVFARENGTVQKLLSDPGVYHNLDAASVALARVLARADKIAADLEVFADKVARRPELIGVGGALRPSSGLKGSPFAPALVPNELPSYRPDWPPALPARQPPPVQGYPPGG